MNELVLPSFTSDEVTESIEKDLAWHDHNHPGFDALEVSQANDRVPISAKDILRRVQKIGGEISQATKQLALKTEEHLARHHVKRHRRFKPVSDAEQSRLSWIMMPYETYRIDGADVHGMAALYLGDNEAYEHTRHIEREMLAVETAVDSLLRGVDGLHPLMLQQIRARSPQKTLRERIAQIAAKILHE